MPSSPLSESTRATLQRLLPAVCPSQITTLSLLIVGVVQSLSCQIGKIARALPLDTSQVAKEQRVRRFLDNPRITQADHYQPVVQQALHGLRRQPVQLLIDRVLVRNQFNILVVSVGFRRRSIPLVWQVLPHRGASNLADQQALITAAVALLPERVRISVHGDSEFRAFALFTWLREQGYDALLGVRGDQWITRPTGPAGGQPLAQYVTSLPASTAPGRAHRTSPVTYLTGVRVGQEPPQGPVNVIAWWERDDDHRVVLHAVMTNRAANAQTKAYGKRRMWIETVFRDWQSGGFHLDQTGLRDPERVACLLLVLALAYLWLVSVGRWVVKRGYRTLIDGGRRRCWQFSLFQLGVGWLTRLHSFSQPLPMRLYLYT